MSDDQFIHVPIPECYERGYHRVRRVRPCATVPPVTVVVEGTNTCVDCGEGPWTADGKTVA